MELIHFLKEESFMRQKRIQKEGRNWSPPPGWGRPCRGLLARWGTCPSGWIYRWGSWHRCWPEQRCCWRMKSDQKKHNSIRWVPLLGCKDGQDATGDHWRTSESPKCGRRLEEVVSTNLRFVHLGFGLRGGLRLGHAVGRRQDHSLCELCARTIKCRLEPTV